MTLHANSNHYEATAAPGTLLSTVGAVGDCYDKAKTGVCPDVAPFCSVRESIGDFKKMLKLWGGQENTLFP